MRGGVITLAVPSNGLVAGFIFHCSINVALFSIDICFDPKSLVSDSAERQ